MATLREQYEARKTAKRWLSDPKDRLALVAIVIATAGLLLNFSSIAVAIRAFYLNRSALVTANRAWIAPRGVDLTAALEAGKDVQVNLYYANVGNSPAGIILGFESAVIRNPPDVAPTAPLPIGVINRTCEGLIVPEETTVVFPDEAKDRWTTLSMEGKNITPGVVEGSQVLALRGCIVYRTFEEIHRSGFCYLLKRGADVARRSSTAECGDGNFAD
jgi:hypothetical protein